MWEEARELEWNDFAIRSGNNWDHEEEDDGRDDQDLDRPPHGITRLMALLTDWLTASLRG
jgi:hypothetical protein